MTVKSSSIVTSPLQIIITLLWTLLAWVGGFMFYYLGMLAMGVRLPSDVMLAGVLAAAIVVNPFSPYLPGLYYSLLVAALFGHWLLCLDASAFNLRGKPYPLLVAKPLEISLIVSLPTYLDPTLIQAQVFFPCQVKALPPRIPLQPQNVSKPSIVPASRQEYSLACMFKVPIPPL